MESILKKIIEKRHKIVKKNQRNSLISKKIKEVISKVIGRSVNLGVEIKDKYVVIKTDNKTISSYIFTKKEKIKELLRNQKINLDLIIK